MEAYDFSPARKEYDTLMPKRDELPFFEQSREKIWEGVKLIANATFSTSLSLLCVYMVNMISLAFISNLRDAAMIGGIGLGFVCSNCCAYILVTSIDQGVNALAAQAFGAKRYSFMALSYHRGLFLQVIAIIPVIVLLSFTKEILVFFSIEETIAQYAWDYIKYAFPSIFFYGIFDATKSLLFAQKIFVPILVTQFIAMILHIFWGWLFISHFEMGPAGAGMAKNIFELFNMTVLLIYINKSQCCKESWVPFSQINFKEIIEWEGIRKFMSFTIPIAAILFLDMACYEVFSILAGQFDEDQLAVHVAVANSATLYYSLPLGLSIAIMTYVSHAMGAGHVNAAKNHTYCGVIVDVIITTIFVVFIWIFEDQWASIFSANESIKHLLHNILNIYLLMVFFDGIQVALSGTLKGIGKQNSATIGMVISYYFVALPLIYFFAFNLELQVMGIWIGFLIGIIALLGLYLVVLNFTDFPAQAKLLALNFSSGTEMKLLAH